MLVSSQITLAAGSGRPMDVVQQFQDAFVKKDLRLMEKTVSPDLIVLEGTNLDRGWKAYRDDHISKEMEEWTSFQIKSSKPILVEESKDSSLVILDAVYEIKMPKEIVRLQAAESFVLRKRSGQWKIVHVHSSAKRLKEGDVK